jgi:hypothetical protein
MSEELKTEDNKIDDSRKLDSLKTKAGLLGVSYSPNIGIDALKKKIDGVLEDQGGNKVENETTIGPDEKIALLEKAARKPILCKVVDLDNKMSDINVEPITVGNRYFKVGCLIQKDTEQVVPAAIVKALKAKTMVAMVDIKHSVTKRPTGNKVSQIVPRFNVIIIDENYKPEGY